MKSRGKSPGLAAAAASTASNSSSGGGGGTRHHGHHHHHQQLQQHHRHQRASTSSQRGSVSGRSDSGAAAVAASSDNTLAVPSMSSNHRHSDAASDIGVSYHHNSPSTILDASSSSTNSANQSSLQGEHGNSVFYDDPDSSAHLLAYHGHDPELTQKAISATQAKSDRLKELISDEQRTMDGNVDEYLKLSQQAEDRQQQTRIKQLFEKKNQKSAQTIAQQQKKLEEYRRKVSELQERGLRPRSSHRLGAGLKSVGGNIRDGVGNVISKPKELASKLKHKAFGSADNLDTLSKDSDKEKEGKKSGVNRNPHGSASLPRDSSGGPGFVSSKHSRKCISDDGRRSERSVGTASREDVIDDEDEDSDESSDDDDEDDDDPHHLRNVQGGHPGGTAPAAVPVGGPSRSKASPQRGAGVEPSAVSSSEWKTVMEELTLQKEEMEELRQQFRQEVEKLRQQHRREMEALTDELSGERERFERLEVQVNDMMELHQNEVINIKRDMDEKEEKVLYQSEEQLVDVREHLMSLDTKVTSMEHQAVQQQYLNIEGLDTNDARAVMVKLVNVGITFVHIILFVAGIFVIAAKPFVRTSPRLGATSVLVCLFAWAYFRQEDLRAAYHARFPSAPDNLGQEQDSSAASAVSGASSLSR